MSRLPRILPLAGVAVAGLIAVKAIAGLSAVPDLLSAGRAAAEEAPAKATRKLNAAAAQTPLQSKAAAPAPKPIVCAPGLNDLAREAGLTPSELTTLQSLQARRGQLDQREHDIDTQRQLLAAAELKLDAKLRALTALRDEMKGLVTQADQAKQAEVDRLVRVYEKMKPRDAAAVMAQLDDRVRLPVASKMKEAALAAVLSQMQPAEAKRLTEALARRFAPSDRPVQAAANPPPPPPRPALASAAPPASDDPDEAPTDAPAVKSRAVKPAPKLAAARKTGPKPLIGAPQAKDAPPKPAEPTVAKADAPALPPPLPTASPGQVAAAGDTRAK